MRDSQSCMQSFSLVSRCTEVSRGTNRAFLDALCQWVSDLSWNLTSLLHPHGVSVRQNQLIIPILQQRHRDDNCLHSLLLFIQETRRKSKTCAPVMEA